MNAKIESRPMPKHWAFVDLTGRKFGRVTVVSFHSTDRHNKARWNCQCECGRQCVIVGSLMTRGHTRSCGCFLEECRRTNRRAKIHGLSKSREYGIWVGMWRRCTDATRPEYGNYGGRGISVCESWRDVAVFYEDMGPCPKGHTLDRIDNDGNYCKENCRWASHKQQATNKRTNRWLTYLGKSYTLSQLARATGVKRVTIAARLKRGWSVERAVTEVVA